MRGEVPAIESLGASLVVLGNGAPHFARAFKQDLPFEGAVLCDTTRAAYREAGLKSGVTTTVTLKGVGHALRALKGGFRQTATKGDPFQQGGVLVVRPDGVVTYRYVSNEAGDHAPPGEILAGVRRAVA